MKVQVLRRLNEKQTKKVQELVKACSDYEPLTLTPPLTAEGCFDEKLPCFYLLYENNELISFLSLFLPEPAYGEVMAFTHPMARQRGYFKRLWNEALTGLDKYIEDMELLFVTDGNSKDAVAALKALEGEYQYSEYILEKDFGSLENMGENLPSGNREKPASLTLFQIGEADFSTATALHEAIFCDGIKASRELIRQSFQDPGSRTFLAQTQGQTIGIFHLTEWSGGTYLSGFGIHPDFQGQGFGKELLRAVVSQLTAGHTLLSLHVSSLDEAACCLYRNEGFTESSRRDYYY